MKKLYSILLIASCFTSEALFAQQSVNFSLYRYHLNMINPAFAGVAESPVAALSVRSQWVGVDDAPTTQGFSLTYPGKKRLHEGISVITDKIFIESQTQVFADFSYELPMSNSTALYLGIKAGATFYGLEASRLNNAAGDSGLADQTGAVPNLGVGFYYDAPNFFFSFSIPRMFSAERYKERNEQTIQVRDQPHYYLSSGLRLPLTTQWDFRPTAFLSMVADAPNQYVLDALFTYDKKFDLGLQYYQGNGLGATTFLHVSDGLRIGYAYTASVSNDLNAFSRPTHELGIILRTGAKRKGLALSEEDTLDGKKREEKNIGTANKEETSGTRNKIKNDN